MKWFKHDTDANRDPKLEKILMRYGAEGYALYWLCIELIAAPIDKSNINFELEHDAEILAHRLKMDSKRVEEIMLHMTNIGLFEIDATTQRITCLKLAERIENSIVKNPEIKRIQHLMADDPGQSRTIPDNSGKVRPEENRLDKKEKEGRAPRTAAAGFEEFWAVYPKKRKKKTALDIWNRKKPDASALIADVRARLAADKQWLKGFVPDPTTYLNGERWNDDMGDSTSAPKTTDDYALEFGITRRPDESDERFQVRVRDVMLVREGRT